MVSWRRIFFAITATLAFGFPASARVFDIKSEKFAAYFAANYAPSTIDKAPFEKASDNSEVYDTGLSSVYTGEFGFIYSARFVNLRFAMEVIRPPTAGVVATDASGTKLYDLNSDISIIAPKIGIEVNLKQWSVSRLFINADFGTATLGLNNTYVFTAAGTAATGKTDYAEEGRATGNLIESSLGWELLLFDTTTVVLTAGYRSLSFDGLIHNRDANTLAGNKVKGDDMLNTDGSQRALDFTGYFVGAAFRFWIY